MPTVAVLPTHRPVGVGFEHLGPEPRRAVVFGGSEGIGLSIAAQLVDLGSHVTVVSRSADKLRAAVAELERHRRELSQRIDSRVLDITDEPAVIDAIDALVAEHGAPDLVVITAGYARPGWFEDLPSADIRGMVEVNLLGTIQVCRAVLPHLRAAGGGTIVATSSMAGLTGVYGLSVYCATKFGVVGFCEALSREVRRDGIRVLVLCPPNTQTPGLTQENLHKPPEVLAAEQKARIMSAPEVAAEVLRALRRRRGLLVVPGLDNRLAALAARHLPAVADLVMRRR